MTAGGQKPPAPKAPRPLQNRVDPFSAILSVPERGRLMGNRGGRMHDDDQRLKRRWTHKTWIACVCAFKGRWRPVFGRGYTELFFRDEPTALAAGHRPCFECRRAEARAFQAAFPGGPLHAPDMDAILHTQRLDPARLERHWRCDALPEGAMALWEGAPHLWWRARLWRWSFGDYGAPVTPGSAAVTVLTPPAILSALTAGYRPREEGLPG